MNATREFRNSVEEEEEEGMEIRWRRESFHSLRIKFHPSLLTKVTIED